MSHNFSESVSKRFGWHPIRMFALWLVLFWTIPGMTRAEDLKALIDHAKGLTNPVPATNPALPTSLITNVVSTNATSAVLTNALDDKSKLGIGDRLSYRIVEDLEEARPLMVTDSGELDVPLIGRIAALDKTCRELAQEIKTKLEDEYYYHATVVLAVDLFNRTRGKVYLVGYVRAPGPQEIPSDEVFTLSKAIMRAGGFGDYADKRHVRVTRKGGAIDPSGKILEVDVGAVIEEGRAEKDVKLEVGDLIFVPSRLFKF